MPLTPNTFTLLWQGGDVHRLHAQRGIEQVQRDQHQRNQGFEDQPQSQEQEWKQGAQMGR